MGIDVRRKPNGGWGVYDDDRLISDHRTRDGAVAAYRNLVRAGGETP